MEYTILSASKKDELIALVNKFIQDGWLPQGGVCESGLENSTFYIQAMIKK